MDSHQDNSARPTAIGIIPVLVGATLIGGFSIFADYYAVSPNGSVEILTLRDFLLFPACVAVPGIFIGAIYCLRKATRKNGLRRLLSCLVFVVVIVLSARIEQRIRMNAFSSLAERSQPLVAAIKAYEQRHGKPPASLDILVPEYLPALPNTGMGAYSNYMYMVATESRNDDGNPWVIIVTTPTGIMNFDRFFYYPRQNYPSHLWETNPVERVGDWVYVHE